MHTQIQYVNLPFLSLFSLIIIFTILFFQFQLLEKFDAKTGKDDYDILGGTRRCGPIFIRNFVTGVATEGDRGL